MKPAVALLVALLLTLAVQLSVAPTLAEAHDVPYFQITVPGNPAYVVAEGFGVRTIEKQVVAEGTVFSEYWEFLGNNRIRYMTFFRKSTGESFEVVKAKEDIGFTPEAVEQLRRISRILRWYLPGGAP